MITARTLSFCTTLVCSLTLGATACTQKAADDDAGDGGAGPGGTETGGSGPGGGDGGAGPGGAGGGGEAGGPPVDLALVDCVAEANAADLHCQNPNSADLQSVGAGVKVGAGAFAADPIGRGFVQGSRLVVAAEMGMQTDERGIILAVDLVTGDRTVLSGRWEDAADGPKEVGTGPDLGRIVDVDLLSDGSMVALLGKGTAADRLVKIDGKSGDRTDVFATPTPGSQRIQCGDLSEDDSKGPWIDLYGGIAVGDDDAIYVSLDGYGSTSQGQGVAKFQLDGSCDVVAMTNAAVAEDNKGTGPTISSDSAYEDLRYQDGKIWALLKLSHSVVSIDVATGDRKRVSASSNQASVGMGPDIGTDALVIDGDAAYTFGTMPTNQGGGMFITVVNLGDGNRAELAFANPVMASLKGITSAASLVPGTKILAYARKHHYFAIDAASGLSNLMSY